MELYIGGYKQGKYNYVLTKRGIPEERIWNEFHRWFRQEMQAGKDAEADAWTYLDAHPDCAVISDEVGCGLVPVDSFEREYRERLGRMLTQIAGRAERVERILCGIGQRIK